MLDGVTISNIRMQNARTPIFIRLGKRTRGVASYLRNVMILGVNATGAIVTSSITSVPGMPVEDITLADISIETSEHGRPDWVRQSVPEQAANYPEARMFGCLSASGLYAGHVNRLRLCNLRLNAVASDVRPAVVCDDVHDLDISGLSHTSPRMVPSRPLSYLDREQEFQDQGRGDVSPLHAPRRNKGCPA